ncbi:transposase, Ptta/En/Spm, P-loop containing nucleoside triphosphate hydrolase [Artemisia annua]|uniref:Transposase, Ptta/En/Spm, P-loop containing nucleoside triphosphate hydrolase n=1 Tax=Artemisia annua TaxID=35608 RepID=A0A2U1KWM0_ARTAN|nr:transposase, Ptta/En/Spm, P-loop containing nucleoside triphosphate hydrolase [Artemisia annua]
MENKRMQRQVSTRNTNDYEMSRRSRIQENQQRLQALGVKNLAKSLTSLVESDKTKKKKKKPTDTSEKDADYMSGSLFVVRITKFYISEAGEKWILQSFGRKVKNWRARVKEYYHDPYLSVKQQISSRPKQVQKKQWKKLVKYWNKEKTKSLSEKNKENRAKKKMIQRTGKKKLCSQKGRVKATLYRRKEYVYPKPCLL